MTHNVVDTQVTPTGRMEVLSRAEASSLLDNAGAARRLELLAVLAATALGLLWLAQPRNLAPTVLGLAGNADIAQALACIRSAVLALQAISPLAVPAGLGFVGR